MYKRLRRLRIILSLLLLAALTVVVLDAAFADTHLGGILQSMQMVPAILTGAAVWIVTWPVVTMTVGRVYCSTVCPLGTVQDIAAYAGMRMRKPQNRRYRYRRSQDAVRVAVPLAVGACLFLGFMPAVHHTDPYTLYGRIVLGVARMGCAAGASLALSAALLAVIGGMASRRGRLYCNSLCPLGGLLGLLSRQPIYRVDIDTDKCIHCGRCEDVCKSECIDLSTCVVDNTRCVMCMDCTAICPNDAIVVRHGRYRLSTPMMQRLSPSQMSCEAGKVNNTELQDEAIPGSAATHTRARSGQG